MHLTPLEVFFVKEFCRSAGVSPDMMPALKVKERSRDPVGFMTRVTPSSVSPELRFESRVFSSLRVACVGPDQLLCGMVLFFDGIEGKLEAIEGFVCMAKNGRQSRSQSSGPRPTEQ
ncbi:hypothetical protein [Mesorhizobium sp. M1273]|uniref:hypothetical protein n=1 Tax=Mesorhizobium sp. M1273 TaxID=2957075 RepID=UPI003334D87D